MIVPPIFIAEGLDVRVCRTAEEAGHELEPWWVQENRGQVYDSEGRLLRLEAGKIRVKVLQGDSTPTHAGELRSLLRKFLKAVNDPAAIDGELDLPYLVDACRKFLK